MGILDKLFGTKPPAQAPQQSRGSADEQAIERYRYLLRTAPPDAIEQAHQEAFAQLSPAQRAQVLTELTRDASPWERANAQPEPNALARLATRAELRQPGTLERVFGGARFGGAPGMGMGGSFAGTLLSSIAGTFIGTAIAHQFLGGFGDHADGGAHADADNSNDQDNADHEQDQHEEHASNDDFDGDDLGGDDFGGDDFDV
jgi:hypothetical protein